jgi:tetratricopeptide (TPR) repeat protein
MESALEYLKKKEIDKLSKQTEELRAELAEFWTCKGKAFRNRGKTAEAEGAFAKAKELGYKGKYDEAVQAYNKAIEIYPEYKEAWYNKGIALTDQGKYDEAVQAFDKAIEIYPEYKEAWFHKSLTLEKRSQTKNTSKKDADDAVAAKVRAIMLGYKDKY